MLGKAALELVAYGKDGGRLVEKSDDAQLHAKIAADFVKPSPEDRARTLVLDPTREGRTSGLS